MPTVTLANGRTFQSETGVAVLDSAIAAGLTLEYGCRTGRCGTCKTRVQAGRTALVKDETSLTGADVEAGFVLTCARSAVDDLALDIVDLPELAGLKPRTFPCRVDAIERSSADVVTVTLRLPPTAGFAFRAGQYIDITAPGGVRRSYSLASAMDAVGSIELHVRRFEGGAMSRYWFETAKPNDLLRFNGPLGTFFLRDEGVPDVIFLATGTGYAPVHSMLRQIEAMAPDRRPRSVRLLWGGRVPADLYAEPSRVHPELRYTPVLSRANIAWSGARGHVQDELLREAPDLSDAVVYACGSDAMIHSARTCLIEAGLQPKRFRSDAFVSSS